MSDSINNNAGNLADIMGLSAVVEPTVASTFMLIVACITLLMLCAFLYYQFTQSLKGQLRQIKHQLNHSGMTTRESAHNIARLLQHQSLTNDQAKALKTLRFSPQNPAAQHIIEFINRVK